MVLRSFVKSNLLFRIMDPLKRKSPVKTYSEYQQVFLTASLTVTTPTGLMIFELSYRTRCNALQIQSCFVSKLIKKLLKLILETCVHTCKTLVRFDSILFSFLASDDCVVCRLLMTFKISLDPDQDRQNVGPDLDSNFLNL